MEVRKPLSRVFTLHYYTLGYVTLESKHGPCGLIAGTSVGLGAAFTEEVAKKKLNLVLIARRSEPLLKLEKELTTHYGIEVRTVQLDLASLKPCEITA